MFSAIFEKIHVKGSSKVGSKGVSLVITSPKGLEETVAYMQQVLCPTINLCNLHRKYSLFEEHGYWINLCPILIT